MVTKKCVQCGKKFTITDSEIDFFESKNLSIPKRCKQCREKNKNSYTTHINNHTSTEYNSYYKAKPITKELISFMLFSLLVSIILAFFNIVLGLVFAVIICCIFAVNYFGNKIHIQEFDLSPYKYTFYNTDSMVEHYVKHGKQTDSNSMESYLFKANLTIIDKNNVSKRSKDNDTIYYNRKTNEFVVVAKAGYIRTYFIASDHYFNKQ